MPLDVAAHALAERRDGRPPQLDAGALAARRCPGEVARPARRVARLHVADDRVHRAGDLRHADVLVTHQVVDAVGGDRRQRPHHAVGQVLDIHEAARLAPVPDDRQGPPGQRLGHERRDDGLGPRTRPVGDPEAQDRVLEPVELLVRAAVELARQLRGAVQVPRRVERHGLVQRVRLRVRVHPDGRRVDHAADLRAPCRLEHVQRAAGVALLGADGMRPHLVDVRSGRQVEDRIAALHRLAQPVQVAQVAAHRLHDPGGMVGGCA